MDSDTRATPPKRGRRAIRTIIGLLVFLVMAVVIYTYGPHWYDQYAASQYTPTPEIAGIEGRIDLTPQGKTLFYASDPSIEDKDTFNRDCQSTERTTAMLGCYYHRKIYLFRISNAQLDGAMEVTAAHETLHAAYDRLPIWERLTVNRMIEDEYAKIKNDPTIQSLMTYYNHAEPGADLNELHSIIGTTIASLPPDLEHYYAQYFTDRQAVVAMNTKYNAVFTSLEQHASDIAAELKTEETALNQALTNYNDERTQLDSDIAAFNQRSKAGYYPTTAAFNTARSALVARVDELNTMRDSINQRVDRYNQKVAELNSLSVQQHDLYKSINGADGPAAV